MRSRTHKPFLTTNLVVIAPSDTSHNEEDRNYAIYGDALIMDPGCLSDCHAEVMCCHKYVMVSGKGLNFVIPVFCLFSIK